MILLRRARYRLPVLLVVFAPQAPAQQLGRWETRAPMPSPRQEVGVGTLDGKIYVVGGRAYVLGGEGNPAPGSGGVFRQVEAYDPVSDSWRAMMEMPVGRHGIGTGVLEGTIFVPGGATMQGFGATGRHDVFMPLAVLVTFDGTPLIGPLKGGAFALDNVDYEVFLP